MNGFTDEETFNRSSIHESYRRVGSKPTDDRHSSGCLSQRNTSNPLCINSRDLERSRVAGCKQGMASTHSPGPRRIRASMRGFAGTSGVHCQKMGQKGFEMKTLVTAIQKGGQGKTFATCHLALDFLERGLRVAVADLDVQGNASYTLSKFKSNIKASQLFNGSPDILTSQLSNFTDHSLFLIEGDPGLADIEGSMNAGEAATKLKKNLDAISDYFDVLLIDTPPSLGVIMSSAVIVSDYMLSPLEMEAYSLQGFQKMVTVINNLRKLNPSLKFLGMVPNKVDGRKPRHVKNLSTLRQSYPDLMVPFSIGLRDSIAQALGERMAVWDVKKTAARVASNEVRALAQYVVEKMEIEQ